MNDRDRDKDKLDPAIYIIKASLLIWHHIMCPNNLFPMGLVNPPIPNPKKAIKDGMLGERESTTPLASPPSLPQPLPSLLFFFFFIMRVSRSVYAHLD